MSYKKTIEKCCLKLDAIPENYTGQITVNVPTDQVGAQADVRIVVYKGGIESTLTTTGTASAPAPDSLLTITDTTDIAAYFSRYSEKVVIEAFNDAGERIYFEDSDAVFHPSICFCAKPCIPGVTPPDEITVNEYIELCEEVC